MGRVRNEARIDAPIERVWEVMTDPNRIPEWQTNVVEIKDAPDRLDRVGAVYTAVQRIVGRRLEGRWEVSAAEPPRLLELTGSAPGGGRATAVTRLESRDGATEVSFDLDYVLPGGFGGDIADRLFVERAIERMVRHSNENLKALCEEAVTAQT